MRRLLQRARRTVDPEHFAGLVHACRYAGLLDASVAAHEEARRLDPRIPTSVVNSYQMLGDYERILRIDDGGDADSRVMALYRLGRREEALASWQRAPADAPPTYKVWDELIVAVLSDAPDAREVAERAVGQMSWNDPEGYTTGAIILSKLGSHDLALHALGAAVDGGYTRHGTAAARPLAGAAPHRPALHRDSCGAHRPAVTRRWPCSAPRAASGCSGCARRPDVHTASIHISVVGVAGSSREQYATRQSLHSTRSLADRSG